MWTQLKIGYFDVVLAVFYKQSAYKTVLCRASGKNPQFSGIQLTWVKTAKFLYRNFKNPLSGRNPYTEPESSCKPPAQGPKKAYS